MVPTHFVGGINLVNVYKLPTPSDLAVFHKPLYSHGGPTAEDICTATVFYTKDLTLTRSKTYEEACLTPYEAHVGIQRLKLQAAHGKLKMVQYSRYEVYRG